MFLELFGVQESASTCVVPSLPGGDTVAANIGQTGAEGGRVVRVALRLPALAFHPQSVSLWCPPETLLSISLAVPEAVWGPDHRIRGLVRGS